MSQRKRGRITVQSQPTGAARATMKLIGVVHAVLGFVFVVVSLTEVIPNAGLFGLAFLVVGAFFCINGIRMVVSKNDMAHRVGYDVETGVEEETIVGLLDEVEGNDPSSASREHDHIPSTALDARDRLEQLETLKNAGLITNEEYRQKRAEILKEL